MASAQRLQYDVILPSGRPPSSSVRATAVAVYVPDRKMLVRIEGVSDPTRKPLHEAYQTLMGDEAETRYRSLLDGKKPEAVEVSDAFIEWAEANYRDRNPDQAVRDILTPK